MSIAPNTGHKDKKAATAYLHYSMTCMTELAHELGETEDERHFRICPVPGGSLQNAEARYRGLYGTVSCQWEKIQNNLRIHVEIPANCTAELYLPDDRRETLESGRFSFDDRYG